MFKANSFMPRIALGCMLGATALSLSCKADEKSDFVEPPLKFRSRPLWFWNNTAVTAAGVEAQLQGNRDRSGYGGLAPLPFGEKFTPKYLSEEYFELYGAAVKKARELGMFLTIYDEYGFPSGSCGANMGDGIPRFKNKYPEATLRRLDKHEDDGHRPRRLFQTASRRHADEPRGHEHRHQGTRGPHWQGERRRHFLERSRGLMENHDLCLRPGWRSECRLPRSGQCRQIHRHGLSAVL